MNFVHILLRVEFHGDSFEKEIIGVFATAEAAKTYREFALKITGSAEWEFKVVSWKVVS